MVLPPPVGSDVPPVGTAVVAPSVALALPEPSVALALAVSVADTEIEIEDIVLELEFEFEFDSSPLPLPLSPHAPVKPTARPAARMDITDSKRALRFISW